LIVVDEESSEINSQGAQSRTSSLSAHDLEPKRQGSKKKDKGIFKGLGSVFRCVAILFYVSVCNVKLHNFFIRLGKPRNKTAETPAKLSVENLHAIATPAEKKVEEPSKKQAEIERQKARALLEQQKINEQYRKLQEKQRQMDAQQDLQLQQTPSGGNRAERIHQLRAEHQRRHRERQGQYPRDHEEEVYERRMQEFEQSRVGHLFTLSCVL
jgi:hypothetical protein